MVRNLIRQLLILGLVVFFCTALNAPNQAQESADTNDLTVLETQFRELPIAARRLTGPLFWLHGDEAAEQLERYFSSIEGSQTR